MNDPLARLEAPAFAFSQLLFNPANVPQSSYRLGSVSLGLSLPTSSFFFFFFLPFILAFCRVDIDVCIYCTCVFFSFFFFYCQLCFDVDDVQRCELVNFYGL